MHVIPTSDIVGDTITNRVAVSTATPELNSDNNTDDIFHIVGAPELDLLVNKTDAPDPVERLTPATYTISVRNNGPSAAFNVTVRDTFPAQGMAYQSHNADDMSCTTTAIVGAAGGELECTIDYLPAGGERVFTVQMEAIERGRWTNTVAVESDETRRGYETVTANNTTAENTTVRVRSDLTVIKFPSVVNAGLRQHFNWIIMLASQTGPGLDMSEAVRLTDTLPANMILTGNPITDTGTCTGAVGGREISCELGDVEAGDFVTVILPVRVTAISTPAQVFSNTVSVTTESLDTNLANNTDTASITIHATSISGSIWRDFNGDDTRDSHDSGIAGQTVLLRGIAGTVIEPRSTVTAADGSYSFGLLPPGTYTVEYSGVTEPHVTGAGKAHPGAQGGSALNDKTIQGITPTVANPAVGYDFTVVPEARLALLKQFTGATLQPDGSYFLQYALGFHNQSLEPISNIRIHDLIDLGDSFGTFVTGTTVNPGEYRLLPPSSLPSVAHAPGFNGVSQTLLYDLDTTLAAGGRQTLLFSLHVNPVLPRVTPELNYVNQAQIIGTGDWSGQTTSDYSNDGNASEWGVTRPTAAIRTFDPAISLTKTALFVPINGTTSRPLPGDRIQYQFTVRNTGKTPLLNVTVTDPMPGLVWVTQNEIPQLNPGASNLTSYSAYYILTQADIDNGFVQNTATATGQWGVDDEDAPLTVFRSSTETVTGLFAPGLVLEKTILSDTIGDPRTAVGDEITYGFTLTNTGNTTLRDVVVNDARLGAMPDGLAIDALAPGAVVTLAPATAGADADWFTYAVTQADIDAGQVVNTARASANFGDNDYLTNSAPDSETQPLYRETGMVVTKLIDSDSIPAIPRAGTVIRWNITVENTGNVTLSNVSVADDLPGVTIAGNPIASIAPGTSASVIASYTLTQADINAGTITNQAQLSASPPPGLSAIDMPSGNDPATPNGDPTVTDLPQVPEIGLVKALVTDATDPLLPGAELSYRFTITNTGNLPLGDIALTDSLPGFVFDDPTALDGLVLAPAGQVIVTGQYMLQGDAVEAGQITNSATVSAIPTAGPADPVSDDASITVPLVRAPAIALVKAIDTDLTTLSTPPQPDDQVHYTFTITNTGNVVLSNVTLADLVGEVVLSGDRADPLPVGGVDATNFTGVYTLTQADIDAGSFANSAEVTATGTGPAGTAQPISDLSGTAIDNDDQTVITFTRTPGLSVVKTADDSALSTPPMAGEAITYSFVVTNTGNVTLRDVALHDPLIGPDALLITAEMGPQDEVTHSVIYTLTQADIQAGAVVNTAFATATDSAGTPADLGPVHSNEVTVPLDQRPSIAATKSADADGVGDLAVPGQVIEYTFTLRNTGNVVLENVTLSDPLFGVAPADFTIGTLDPGQRVTVGPASYPITQADIDRGAVVNQATASGSFDDGSGPVVYTDLTGLTEADDAQTIVPLGQNADIALVKIADADAVTDRAEPGQEIEYRFAVTNTGNVTLRDVEVSDALAGIAPGTFDAGMLAPGETVTVGPAIYAITLEDIIAQKVENRALVTGDWGPLDNPEQVSAASQTEAGLDAPTTVALGAVPSIALIKNADDLGTERPVRGDLITYTFSVINTGNVPLENITLTDDLPGIELLGGPIGALAPGASDHFTFSATYPITQADIDTGRVSNSATVTAIFDDGSPTPPEVRDISGTSADNDDETVVELPQVGTIALIKISDASALGPRPEVGDEISYRFTITNTGNVTLTDVTLTDDMLGTGLTGAPIATLAPNGVDTDSYRGIHALTQADIDTGRIENQAEVTGDYGDDGTGTKRQARDLSGADNASDAPDVVEIAQVAAIALVKTADDSAITVPALPGQDIEYAFAVTNTGNVTLTDITVTDDLPGLVLSGGPIATLAPGDTDPDTYRGLYAITEADIIATEVENTAVATGTWGADSGQPRTISDISGTDAGNDTPSVVALGYPELAFDISVGALRDLDGDGIIGIGDQVIFRFEVINTGTVPLVDVIIDPATLSLPLPGLSCGPVTLPVDGRAVLDCTGGAHVVTAGDIAAGQISLAGEAMGASQIGVIVRAASAAPVTVAISQGGLSLEKLAGVSTAMVGDHVPYVIRLSNSAQGVPVTARLVDTVPQGFTYRAGSAVLDGVAVTPIESGRSLMFEDVAIAPGQDVELVMELFVTSAVQPGLHTNRVRLISPLSGRDIAPEASATVRIEADAVFQCASVIGRVFDDANHDGHMTGAGAGAERGLPNVRLVTPTGLAIHTDAHGRYNVPCAALPQSIGSNFMLRLDERTLPTGYRLTTENPRVVRVTPGMLTRLDFGATLSRLIRVDVAASAFDRDAMGQPLADGLRRMVAELHDRPAMLRITYQQAPGESDALVARRIGQVEQALRDLWPANGRYQLNIETMIQRAGATQ